MEKGNKMIASGFQTPQSPMARAIIEQSRSHGKTAELEKLKSQYCERICQNCKCNGVNPRRVQRRKTSMRRG